MINFLTLDDHRPSPRTPIENLIGTENCDYCNALTECLSLPDDGEYPRVACLKCIGAAFDEFWGRSETK